MPMAELKEGGTAEIKHYKIANILVLTRLWSQSMQGGDCNENNRFSSTKYVFGCNCVGCGNSPDSQEILWWFGAWQFIGGL